MSDEKLPRTRFEQEMFALVRLIIGGVIITALIIAGLTISFADRNARETELQQQTLFANLAQACVLALPIGEQGRVPADVEHCFTQYGLQAPSLVHD